MYVIAIGTSHIEFSASSNNSGRVVQNIWPIPANTGTIRKFHATHIAGTVGGNTVGISPSVSMFGLDVFGSSGSAPTTTILAAFDKIAAAVAVSKKPSVVNMSLGGTYTLNCGEESTIYVV
jgi:subtilisin family serine protease